MTSARKRKSWPGYLPPVIWFSAGYTGMTISLSGKNIIRQQPLGSESGDGLCSLQMKVNVGTTKAFGQVNIFAIDQKGKIDCYSILSFYSNKTFWTKKRKSCGQSTTIKYIHIVIQEMKTSQ